MLNGRNMSIKIKSILAQKCLLGGSENWIWSVAFYKTFHWNKYKAASWDVVWKDSEFFLALESLYS